MPCNLDDVLRQLNNSALPSTEEEFITLFCHVFDNHAEHGLANPWYRGRTSAPGVNDAERLRVRFRWGTRSLELQGIYVRNQTPPTRQATLATAARDAWSRPFIRMQCEAGGAGSSAAQQAMPSSPMPGAPPIPPHVSRLSTTTSRITL